MDKDEIKNALKEVLDEEIKPFYVDREIHYQHHEFVRELMDWSSKFKNSFFSTIAKGFAIVIFVLMLLGFIFWGKGHFK